MFMKKKNKPRPQKPKKHFLLVLYLISVVTSFDDNMEKTRPGVITDNDE